MKHILINCSDVKTAYNGQPFLIVQSLAGAKKVHAFVRDADDAIEWIEEKDIVVSSEDYGQDIESVKALIVKHEGFEVSETTMQLYC